MKANASSKESLKEIMNRVSNTDLLSHYLGITELPALINSPIRKDAHPSFYIYSPNNTKVLFKDYATGEKGDIYELLQKVYNITFSQLIKKISDDKYFLNRGDSESLSIKNSQNSPHQKRNVTIRVKVREWKDYDLEYWESFGITSDWLKYAEVYPISHKIIYKNSNRYVFPAAKYSYVFVERKEGNISLKIYSPMSKRFKWTSSNDGSVIGLWTKIPQGGNRLVVCSSLKDALCLWANVGIPCIYVQSETTGISETAREALKKRYSRIFICFDNDAPGLKDGKSLSENTGFENIILPHFEGGKDISDMYKIMGKEKFISVIEPLFK